MRKITMNNNQEITFEQGCNMYIESCKHRNLRNGTIIHYEQSYKQIYKYIPCNTQCADITIATINNFIIEFKKTHTNDMTLNAYARDLKTTLTFLMNNGYVKHFKITLPKADKNPIECYNDMEIITLIKKPNLKKTSFTQYKAWVMVNFLLSTGVRQRSLINIKIKDIDFDNCVVYVNVTKNRKPLIIPLNDIIVSILKEYLKHRQGDDEDYLFCNVYGKQLNKSTVYHSLFEYNKSRGIEKTGMHRFRHTFAKQWILEGGNVVTLSKILGHSNLDITQNYINLLASDVAKEISQINILNKFSKEYIKIKTK